jgi:AcrR family transcriptional regulator
MDANPDGSGEDSDFRSRVAREKRTRMRARLLDATLDLYGRPGRPGPAVIDEIVRQAGVSRGTFYKYFMSVEEVVGELGRAMADEMIRSMAVVTDGLADPAERVAACPLMPLARAAMQPRWAAFTGQVDYIAFLAPPGGSGTIVAGELARARDAGVLDFASLDAAMDLIVGAVAEGTRRLARNAGGADYARELSRMILTGLGMGPARAGPAVDVAWRTLRERGPQLPWWRPLGA